MLTRNLVYALESAHIAPKVGGIRGLLLALRVARENNCALHTKVMID